MSTRSEARQTIVETNLQGKLLDLPAGELRAAIGASYREEAYSLQNETLGTAGRSFLDQAIGIYPSANTNGSYTTKEVYGELLIPLFHDIPGVQHFNLEVGGRMSDYSTTGTSYTYKILGDWQVTDWLRFRGGFNRAERAPNIAELQLAPQQAFRSDPTGDLCSTRLQHPSSADPATNSGGQSGALDVQAVCLALMSRDNGSRVLATDPTNYYNWFGTPGPTPGSVVQNTGAFQAAGPGAGFGYAVGNQYYREHIDATTPALKPEQANTWTAGVVIQSPIQTGLLSRLQLSVDYWNITINDPIGLASAGGALQRCIDPKYNPLVSGASAGATDSAGLDTPASQAAADAAIQAAACQAVYRNPSQANFSNYGQLNTARIYTTYTNDGLVKLSGIDANLNWSTDVGPGTLFLGLNGTYMLHFLVADQNGQTPIEYVGTEGTGLKGLNFGASVRWKLLGNIGYTYKGFNLSLQWQHTPATEDAGEAFAHTDNTGTSSYDLFNINGSYQVTDNLRLRFGIDNLFNKAPELSYCDADLSNNAAGAVEGCSFSYFQDQQGRRFSLGANVKF
jgi:outer membrane receptor protein involved in Fe transport